MAAVTFDDDRLPWLEPYRDPARVEPLRPYGMIVAGGIAALLAIQLVDPRERTGDAVSEVSATAPVTVSPAATIAPTIPSAPARKSVPIIMRPGSPGRVIQLGAFQKIATANRAYRLHVARYPALRSMPRAVVPISTRPSGRMLYALRVGTASRQQSGIVCRRLRASGEQCLVIG